MLHKSLK